MLLSLRKSPPALIGVERPLKVVKAEALGKGTGCVVAASLLLRFRPRTESAHLSVSVVSPKVSPETGRLRCLIVDFTGVDVFVNESMLFGLRSIATFGSSAAMSSDGR